MWLFIWLYGLSQAARRYCPHHVGHYLGMDVHDTPELSRSQPLQPGMTITIEPGKTLFSLLRCLQCSHVEPKSVWSAACLTCLALITPYFKAIRPKCDTFTSNHNRRVVHLWGQWPGSKALPGPGSQDRRRCGDPGQWTPSDSVSRCTKDNCWSWASLCPKVEQHWWLVLWFQWILQWLPDQALDTWMAGHTHSQILIFLLLFVIKCGCQRTQVFY